MFSPSLLPAGRVHAEARPGSGEGALAFKLLTRSRAHVAPSHRAVRAGRTMRDVAIALSARAAVSTATMSAPAATIGIADGRLLGERVLQLRYLLLPSRHEHRGPIAVHEQARLAGCTGGAGADWRASSDARCFRRLRSYGAVLGLRLVTMCSRDVTRPCRDPCSSGAFRPSATGPLPVTRGPRDRADTTPAGRRVNRT